jgi:phytoene desaturase
MIPNELRPRWTDRKVERKRYSCSTFMLYLGVEGEYPEAAHHNIFISEDYDRNLADIEKNHRLSPDPSFYLQNASITDPTLAPPGCSALYLLVPVSHQHPNIDWSKEKWGYRQLALKQLEKIGVRDIERKIRFEKMVTPDDWARDHRLHLGSTFSMAHSLDQMLHLRPQNRFSDVEGVYLVGGGTHHVSGLPVIFESSRISTRLLLEDLGMSDAYPRHESRTAAMQEVA